MDCVPPHSNGADYDNQDFYSVFIHELNETLNAPRQRRRAGSQVPLMFWTDHDCYLLMELARTSPDMIETLPKLKVASDPASTEFFYDRLRTIATAAKLEAATACCTGGNYAVIRKFSEDIAHKFPMPWHAPGWEMHCKNSTTEAAGGYQTNAGPKPSLWPSMFPQQQQQQQRFSTKLTTPFHQASNNTSSVLSQPKIERSFSSNNLSQTPFNNEGIVRPLEKGPNCDDEFMKSQDEFFMGPSSLHSISTCVENNFGSWVPSQQQLQHSSKSSMKTENIRNYLGSSLLQTNPTTMWNPNNVESSEFTTGIRYGARYWPRQQQQSTGFDNGTGSNNKMAQQFPAYVRPNSNNNNNGKLSMGKNNYYCKIQNSNNEGSDSSQSPSPPCSGGSTTSSKESYLCVFCKGNNEPEAIYKSHPLRLNNIVICPSLRNYTCCICKATGDNAHTIKYCPYNKRGYFATRSHEKCNSNNYSRLKMKVQILDDQNGGQNSHNQDDYSPVRRDEDEDDRECDEDDEYDDDSSSGKYNN